MTDFEFEPFLDYAKISDEMVKDLYVAVRDYEAAKLALLATPSQQTAEDFIKTHEHLGMTGSGIQEFLWTVPAMVHLAGDSAEEHAIPGDEDSTIIVMQRCERCGSPLMGWRPNMVMMTPEGTREIEPDDVSWWEKGAVVGKVATGGGGQAGYLIENRELEKHERECVGFPNLEA